MALMIVLLTHKVVTAVSNRSAVKQSLLNRLLALIFCQYEGHRAEDSTISGPKLRSRVVRIGICRNK